MLAKLIVWGIDRQQALLTLHKALCEYRLLGLKHNIEFLKKIISTKAFQQAQTHTEYINHHLSDILKSQSFDLRACLIATHYQLAKAQQQPSRSPWDLSTAWQMNLPASQSFTFEQESEEITVEVTHLEPGVYRCTIAKEEYLTRSECHGETIRLIVGEQHINATVINFEDSLALYYLDQTAILRIVEPLQHCEQDTFNEGQLTAPMPGTVVAVLTENGQNVGEGDSLIIIEAMKMEHTICAPTAGTVGAIFYEVGDQVNEGDELVELHQEGE